MSQKHQTIFRNARADTGYTIISTLLLNDDELSADALALAVAIISKPITWEFNLAWARKRFDWGETKSERTARELIARGFARKHRHREPDGTLGPMVYEFTDVPHKFSKSDQPAINAERPKDIRNQAAKTTERPNLPAENHSAENLPADSAAHINNRDLENTNLNKKNTQAREPDSPKTWKKRDPFGLNPWQAKDHSDVRFDDDFRLVVCNGFEEELCERLKPAGLDLRDALDEAAKYVQRSAAPAELKIQVRSQIARLAREAKERAEVRGARVAKPKADVGEAAGRTRIERMRAEVERRKAENATLQEHCQ